MSPWLAVALLAVPGWGAEVKGKLRHQGGERTYLLYVPRTLDAAKPAPLVLVFHGGYGQGAGALRMTGMDKVAERHGFLAVFPDGLGRAWNAGKCCGGPVRWRTDDVGFAAALIDAVSRERKVDSKRVYATGMSNGAMLAYRLACELSGRIAAVAPVSGTPQTKECRPARSVSVLHFHGTADPRAPFAGGPAGGPPLSASRTDISAADAVAFWRKADGCKGEGIRTYQRGAAECLSYRPCRDSADVALCTIGGGGHSWPGGPPVWTRVLGTPTQDVDASALMWEFFASHPLP